MLLKIKDLEIPICIKNYKTSKSVKIYFKDDVLTITKSPYMPKSYVDFILMNNEDKIYENYKKILEQKKQKANRWETGQNIIYKGQEYTIKKIYKEQDYVRVRLEEQEKIFKIILPLQIQKDEEIIYIKKAIKKLFKENTEAILLVKVPYWSKKMNIEYSSVKVRDAKTRYGSCVPKTKDLHFSSRLIMLKEEAIDAIIVHELSHIVYPNHSKEFYKLIEKYIPNYKQIDKYLKENSKNIEL